MLSDVGGRKVLDRNELVGGLLLLQRRRRRRPCSQLQTASAHHLWYGQCLTDVLDTEAFGPLGDAQQYADPLQPPHPSSPPRHTPGGGAAVSAAALVESQRMFQYDWARLAHVVYLPASLSTYPPAYLVNVAMLERLCTLRFLDDRSSLLLLKALFFNPTLKLFVGASLAFTLTAGGAVLKPYDLELHPLRMQQYVDTQGLLLMVLELALLLQLGYRLGHLTQSIAHGMRQHGQSWVLREAFVLVELGSIGLCMYAAVCRCMLVRLLLSHEVRLPSVGFVDLDHLFRLQSQIVFINFINGLLLIVLLFKFVGFQDKMRLLDTTLSLAWVNLYHFAIVAGFIFCGYAVIGHFLFGSSMLIYSTLPRALQAQFEMMLGAYDSAALSVLAPFLGSLFCITFVFVVSMLLIGALLAIVVDKYCLVLRNSKLGQECEGVGEQLALAYSLLPKVLYLTVKKRVCEATKSE